MTWNTRLPAIEIVRFDILARPILHSVVRPQYSFFVIEVTNDAAYSAQRQERIDKADLLLFGFSEMLGVSLNKTLEHDNQVSDNIIFMFINVTSRSLITHKHIPLTYYTQLKGNRRRLSR